MYSVFLVRSREEQGPQVLWLFFPGEERSIAAIKQRVEATVEQCTHAPFAYSSE